MKTGTTLVDVAWNAASDPGSIPGASTTPRLGKLSGDGPFYRGPPPLDVLGPTPSTLNIVPPPGLAASPGAWCRVSWLALGNEE